MSCTCGSIGDIGGVRLCVEHHRYWRCDKELSSITRVVKGTWPIKPDFSAADPEVLENARQRGIDVDFLFCQWLDGKLREIPEGTREDAKDLFLSLTKWWNAGAFEKHRVVATQVLMADDEIAGTADIVGDGIADLKTVSALEPTYRLQVGGYCHLFESERGKLPDWCGIIHVNKRFREPKWIAWEPSVVVSEFRIALQMYRMVNRLAGKQMEAMQR